MRKNCTVLVKSYIRGAVGTSSASAASSTLIEINPKRRRRVQKHDVVVLRHRLDAELQLREERHPLLPASACVDRCAAIAISASYSAKHAGIKSMFGQ